MDIYFPGTGWIRTERATLDKLERFRTIRGLTSWERTFDVLLGEADLPNGLMDAAGAPLPAAGSTDAPAEVGASPGNGATGNGNGNGASS
jgi:hypothetical protein